MREWGCEWKTSNTSIERPGWVKASSRSGIFSSLTTLDNCHNFGRSTAVLWHCLSINIHFRASVMKEVCVRSRFSQCACCYDSHLQENTTWSDVRVSPHCGSIPDGWVNEVSVSVCMFFFIRAVMFRLSLCHAARHRLQPRLYYLGPRDATLFEAVVVTERWAFKFKASRNKNISSRGLSHHLDSSGLFAQFVIKTMSAVREKTLPVILVNRTV